MIDIDEIAKEILMSRMEEFIKIAIERTDAWWSNVNERLEERLKEIEERKAEHKDDTGWYWMPPNFVYAKPIPPLAVVKLRTRNRPVSISAGSSTLVNLDGPYSFPEYTSNKTIRPAKPQEVRTLFHMMAEDKPDMLIQVITIGVKHE